jgi:hypothetical protein
VVKELTTSDLVIEGGAAGADTIAGERADYYGIPHCTFKANWGYYGKAAGPIRNRWMLEFGMPERVVAFHSNIEESKGTANMVKCARRAGIQVEVIA